MSDWAKKIEAQLAQMQREIAELRDGGRSGFVKRTQGQADKKTTRTIVVPIAENPGAAAALSATLGTMATKGKIAHQADSTAILLATLVADFNALLAKEIAAGHMDP